RAEAVAVQGGSTNAEVLLETATNVEERVAGLETALGTLRARVAEWEEGAGAALGEAVRRLDQLEPKIALAGEMAVGLTSQAEGWAVRAHELEQETAAADERATAMREPVVRLAEWVRAADEGRARLARGASQLAAHCEDTADAVTDLHARVDAAEQRAVALEAEVGRAAELASHTAERREHLEAQLAGSRPAEWLVDRPDE
ncbi:MAG: hypothetical protein QOK04_1153, partial [Solirubrobacteraceae bacterium]|nr:hypothetical protein [Solirubrobacteraceae bacterium]